MINFLAALGNAVGFALSTLSQELIKPAFKILINGCPVMAVYHCKHLFDILIHYGDYIAALVACCVSTPSDESVAVVELSADNET